MRPRVSVIIVNLNGLEHLESCLESLKDQAFRDFEVVLVDNGSRDGSVDFLRERHPWVRLVQLQDNSGFASGNNIGLEHASGEYVVTLNNDTRVDGEWLAKLVAAADAHPKVGMVGCRIVSFKDPDQIDSLGMRICRDGMSRAAYRLQNWSSLSLAPVIEILFPSACAALYRRAMIEEVGFFDDDFFAYCEDTDLGLRGRLAGWGAVLATEAVVFHKYSGTGGVFSPFKLCLVERNHYWVALKNFPLLMLLAVPWHTLRRYLVQARAMLVSRGAGGEFLASESRWALICAILKGTCAAINGVPRMLRKRRWNMCRRKIAGREIVRLMREYQLTFPELLDIPDEV
jgi:GT2 family glycosyltransferase